MEGTSASYASPSQLQGARHSFGSSGGAHYPNLSNAESSKAKGIQLESEDFEIKEIDGAEIDDAELEAVAGGGAREKANARYAKCETTSCILCGLGAGFAIW